MRVLQNIMMMDIHLIVYLAIILVVHVQMEYHAVIAVHQKIGL